MENLNNLENLEKKCNSNKIIINSERNTSGEIFRVKLSLKNSDSETELTFYTDKEIDDLLNTEFEHCEFLGEFNAILNKKNNTIEAALNKPESGQLFKDLTSNQSGSKWNGKKIVLRRSINNKTITITLSLVSSLLILLCKSTNSSFRTDFLSLKISGLDISNNNEALEALKNISNSIFFQIELITGDIIKITKNFRRKRQTKRDISNGKLKLQFPEFSYEHKPFLLYSHGCNPQSLPINKFLAFYQVIEYYFPIFSKLDARSKVANILRDPMFQKYNTSDHLKLIGVIESSIKAGSSEKESIKLVIRECVDNNNLISFIKNNDLLLNFYKNKSLGTGSALDNNQSSQFLITIPQGNSGKPKDIRDDVASRLYEIRCRIVHTKSTDDDGKTKHILPYSNEEKMLGCDLEVVKFIASEVLKNRSTPLF